MEDMQTRLKNAIIASIKKDSVDTKRAILFFSGGVDSSIVGKILMDIGIDVIPITVGNKKSKDMLTAKKHAKNLFKKHIAVYISKKNIEEAVPEVIKITGRNDTVSIAVGCVVYLAAKYASIIGEKNVFTGTGSDEIFAGYSSHEKAMKKGWDEVRAECKRRLENISGDVERDRRICKKFGLNVKTPFLDKEVVDIALAIPPQEKISANEKKIILRKISKSLGIPDDITFRKKLAAQYGANVQKMLKKISKDKGFASIKEYLESFSVD